MVSNVPVAHLGQKTSIKRCPFCNSSDIYKRVRCKSDAKPYKCYKCKKEFDVPVVGEKK